MPALLSADKTLRNSIDTRQADGTREHNPRPSAKPPQFVLRHLEADARGCQRHNPLDTRKAIGERARWDLETRGDDQDSVDVVQTRRRHLAHTPRPIKYLFCAEHHQRLRLLANDAKQQTQILEVVCAEDETATHLSMAHEAHLQQSTEAPSSNSMMAQEVAKLLPESKRAKMEAPHQNAQEGTHDCREDDDK